VETRRKRERERERGVKSEKCSCIKAQHVKLISQNKTKKRQSEACARHGLGRSKRRYFGAVDARTRTLLSSSPSRQAHRHIGTKSERAKIILFFIFNLFSTAYTPPIQFQTLYAHFSQDASILAIPLFKMRNRASGLDGAFQPFIMYR